MKHTWTGWLKAQNTADAGIMLAIGGALPRFTQGRLATQYRTGQIDAESFEHRTMVLNELKNLFYSSKDTVDVRDPGDWVPLNNDGSRVRRTHFNSDGDRSYADN